MTDTNGEVNPLGDLGTSPLVEAKAESLEVLLTDRLRMIFNTMPSKLNFDDKKAVVAYYRGMRGKFLDEEAKKLVDGPKKVRGAVPKSVVEALQASKVNFDD